MTKGEEIYNDFSLTASSVIITYCNNRRGYEEWYKRAFIDRIDTALAAQESYYAEQVINQKAMTDQLLFEQEQAHREELRKILEVMNTVVLICEYCPSYNLPIDEAACSSCLGSQMAAILRGSCNKLKEKIHGKDN